MKTNRIYLLTLLIAASALSAFAQQSKSDLQSDVTKSKSDLQSDVTNNNTSYKIIRFSVYGINTPTDAQNLKSSMESKQGIISCETDIDNGICTVFAGFGIQRKDIVDITGQAGIKTSNYSEEIHLQKRQNATRTQMSDELKQKRMLETYGKLQPVDTKTIKKEKSVIVENKQEMPAGFPKYIDTGHPETDRQNYSQAKQLWINNNPDKYNELFNKNKDQPEQIPGTEFQKMPVERQQHILNNPDKYQVIKQK